MCVGGIEIETDMSIWKWADWITPVAPDNRVSLGEGSTPLVRSRRIGPAIGLSSLYFKLESGNPSGSFKDRFGAAAISSMLENDRTNCIATSSGNTGAALAAYSAAAGIRCRIAIVETAPISKLKQMMAYGADIFRVTGFGLDPDITTKTFETLQNIGKQPDYALQVSAYTYSAAGMTGVETVSFELAEQLDSIDHVFCPAGGGGLCVSTARGFDRLVREGILPDSPAVHCVQPEGNDTIAGPLRDGKQQAQEVTCTAKISGLQVPNVIDGDLVIKECRPTGGTGHTVTDETAWAAQAQLAGEEGIFTEPAGAVALAGIMQAAEAGELDRDTKIVCLVTGIGFKDEASIERMIAEAECPMLPLEELQSI